MIFKSNKLVEEHHSKGPYFNYVSHRGLKLGLILVLYALAHRGTYLVCKMLSTVL